MCSVWKLAEPSDVEAQVCVEVHVCVRDHVLGDDL